VGLRAADVLAAVLLRREPANVASVQPDLAVLPVVDETTLERAQGVPDAIRVPVRRGAVAWPVAVFEDTHPVVLEHDLVLVRVGLCRISRHAGRTYRHDLATP
jgi:hypothetical protein